MRAWSPLLWLITVHGDASCLWSDYFDTCQVRYDFLKTQGLPPALDAILLNVQNDNECVTGRCPPWKCTFSDMLGHCVSLKSRWMIERDIPLFTQLFEDTCNIYSDQNLLSGYSACLSVTNAELCDERGRFCYWQPLQQRNMTGPETPLGDNPCNNYTGICMPRIKTSECAHCWRRTEECFQNCAPFQRHYKALLEGIYCRSHYSKELDCAKNITCRWTGHQCDVRVGGYFRAYEDACPLKSMVSEQGLVLKKKCEALQEFGCNDDPNCRWKAGPVMPNGYCPVVGEWDPMSPIGYCVVDERVQATNMTSDKRTANAIRYYVDTMLACKDIRKKEACLSTRLSSFPGQHADTSKNPQGYLGTAILVCGSVLGAVVGSLALFLIGRKIRDVVFAEHFLQSEKYTATGILRSMFRHKTQTAPEASKFKFKSNEGRNRPDTTRVSVNANNLILGEEALKPFVIDFQVATNLEEGDDEILGNRSGSFVSMVSTGLWKLRENLMELTFDIDQANPLCFLATPEYGEMHWKAEDDGTAELKVVYPDQLPEWLAPMILSYRRELPSISQENYECPECFFDLYLLPVGVMKKHSKRVCPHYIHAECGKQMAKESARVGSEARCPICFTIFSEIKILPDLMKEPSAWFATCDIDLGGTLDKREVEDALGAVMPLDRMKVKKAIKARWSEWDPDGDGTISFAEFMDPENGLRSFVLKHLKNMTKDSFGAGRDNVPDLETHPLEWFEFWDKDCSNTLEQDELVRALVKTFCLTAWGDPIISMAREMKQVGTAMWRGMGFDDDAAVPFETFIQPGGLADCFLHNDINCRFFGDGDGEQD